MSKKMMLIITGAAFILVASSMPVHADRGDRDEGKFSKWKERKEARKQEIFKELNLTDEQKQKLEEKGREHKDGAQHLRNDMRELKEALRQELEKESLDMAKINQIQGQIKEKQSQMMDNRLEGVLELRGVLTPDQYKEFTEKMQEHKDGQ